MASREWRIAKAFYFPYSPLATRHSRLSAHVLISLQMRVGGAQLRHRNLGGVGARDHVADDVIGFDLAAGLDVAEHRSGARRAFGGEHALDALEERSARRVTGGFRHSGAFVENAKQEILAAGRSDDRADRRAHQAGGRGNRCQEQDRKSTRLNSSHVEISYAVFCLKKKKK